MSIKDYYSIRSEDFERLRPNFKFRILDSIEDLYDAFAREFVDLIKRNNSRGLKTKVILPVGPLEYRRVAHLCNKENVSCKNLVIFMMDEYCTGDGKVIPYEHPLSFHRFMDENFVLLLDEDKRIPKENLIFPDPEDPDSVRKRMRDEGGIDVCYGGFGINCHFAFNEPPEPEEEVTEEEVRDSTIRIVDLTRETKTALALGSTFGNWDIIPPKAVTLGMRELLSAGEIHLYFMRTWHAGVMRRALFGPVDPRCPASYIQRHPRVTVTMTSYVAEPPPINVTQTIGLK